MLNKEQQKAAIAIQKFLSQPFQKNSYFTLAGPPGSGKTFMMDHALSGYHGLQGGTISHSAKNVLNSSFTNTTIDCYTVAQLLGMKMKADSEEVQFIVSPKSIPAIKYGATLVIDEVSMINDYLYNKIMNIVNNQRVKLIAVGDPFQLPPVGQEHDSRFFSKIDAELVQSMRFGGEIGESAVEVRNVIQAISEEKDFNRYILDDKFLTSPTHMSADGKGYRFENDIFKLVKTVAREIDDNSDNINHARILAYTNKSVKLLNEGIREYIYGNDPDQFEFNEIVISKGGFADVKNRVPIVHNGELLRVTNISYGVGPYDVPVVYLEFSKDFKKQIPVVQDNEYAKEKYNEVLAYRYKMAKEYNQWPAFYEFKHSFAEFDYAYATTLHKAQGMTLNKVYVLEGEIMGMSKLNWKQKFQALYVAMTRAKDELVIYNKNRS